MGIPTPRTRTRLAAALIATVALVAACGESVPSVAPTPRPTPVVTPDPHLADPATADEVFLALGAAGLDVVANNAAAGEGDRVKRINATYLGWPLAVTQYSTSAALAEATEWQADEAPERGEAPVALAGLNILIEWGPTTGKAPKEPEGRQVDGLRDLVVTLDDLLSPLRARSVVAVTAWLPAPSAPAAAAEAAETADKSDTTDKADKKSDQKSDSKATAKP